MIQIRFTDPDAKRWALGCLAGRFPFKSWGTGEMLVPEAALEFLAAGSIRFHVEGRGRYEQIAPALRDRAPSPVR
jgi:hypothetical protein